MVVAFNVVLAVFLVWLFMRWDGLGFWEWLAEAWPHFDITKHGEVYLRRYFVVNTRGFRVFVHNIRREDDDRDPHDHPASFLTLVLRGGYTDEEHERVRRVRAWLLTGQVDYQDKLRAGSVRFRRAEHVHRVRDVLPNTWTLTIWGRYRRDWGFWDQNWNWIHWREYLGIEGDYAGD